MSRYGPDFFERTYKKAPVARIAVCAGWVDGITCVEKFGRNPVIAAGITADIWDRGGTAGTLIWVAPTQARIHALVSSDAESGGAITVKVWGLQNWDTKETTEIVTMDGTTPVNTVKSYVIIHRMRVVTHGGTSANIGTITATAATDGGVTAQILATKGQTEMVILGIPSSQTAFLFTHKASMNRASGGAAIYANISLLVAHDPKNNPSVFIAKSPTGLSLDGSSWYQEILDVPKVIPGPAIIKMQASSSANSADISAGFSCDLLDNKLVFTPGSTD